MLKRLIPLALALGAALVLLPGAMGHVTTETDDGQYFITTGQQGEPVYTFQTTNLDLIIRENDNGEQGDEVPGVHENLSATLIAPGGEELTDGLTPQFGATGRYEFENGYALTQGGIYLLRLEGTVGDTDVTGEYDMPGPIENQNDVMFPDEGLPSLRDVAELQERVDTLEAEVDSLQAQSDGENGGQDDENGQAPGPGALLVVGLVASIALVMRRVRG